MKNLEINNLLEKYWRAETSIQEEELLRSYFQHGKVAPEHEAFRGLFHFFSEEKATQFQKALSLQNEAEIKPLKHWRTRILSVAAVLLLLISATWFIQYQENQKQDLYQMVSVEDPDKAYEITMGALAILGDKINTGTNHIQENIRHTDRMNIIKTNQ